MRGRVGEMEAKVITVSDGVMRGTREDRSGMALEARLRELDYEVVQRITIADGRREVADGLRGAAEGFVGLIVTTGGTGFSARDLTPEGTRDVLERQAPGLAEAMRAVNPLGRLSRGLAGTIGEVLVLNLPGSPTGARECLDAVADILPHALSLMVDPAAQHPHRGGAPETLE